MPLAGWLNAILCYAVVVAVGHRQGDFLEVALAGTLCGGIPGFVAGLFCTVPVVLVCLLVRRPSYASVDFAVCGVGTVVAVAGVLFCWIAESMFSTSYSLAGEYLGNDHIKSDFTISSGGVAIITGLCLVMLALAHLHWRFAWLDSVRRGTAPGFRVIERNGHDSENLMPFFGLSRDSATELLVRESPDPPAGIYRSSPSYEPWALITPPPPAHPPSAEEPG